MKKPDKLMDLLLQIADNLRECGEEFSQFDINSETETADLMVFSDRIKAYETKGDGLVHQVIIELNHAFITVIEQEDILLLSERMDEVVDGMEECAIYFYMYGLHEHDEYIRAFQKQLGLSAVELYTAIELLVNRKLTNIKEHTVNVKSYEEAGDTIERKAIREIFEKYVDEPVKIIQHKDLYKLLECAVDDCQAVAKTLDMIVMKNM